VGFFLQEIVIPTIVSSDGSGSHFPQLLDERFVHFSRVEVPISYTFVLAVHLVATIPHGTNSAGGQLIQ
jgi:hypothetical protein